MKRLMVALMMLCAFATIAYAKKGRCQDLPNVVVIMADDLGYYDTDIYADHPLHQTPNLSALAAKSMAFTRAYACPLCSPTRSGIIGGQHAARTGFTAATGHKADIIWSPHVKETAPVTIPYREVVSANRMPLGTVSLAEQLKTFGYKTGHFGKWHLGRDPYLAINYGFDVDFPSTFSAGPPGGYINWDGAKTTNEHIEYRTASEAIQFIGQNKSRPFFLNYWMWSVHSPHEARQGVINKYQALIDADPTLNQYNALYAAMVEHLDDNVGRLMTALDNHGLTDNTVIIFCSDNGGLEKPTSSGYVPTDNAPLKGGKSTLWEGGINIPFMVSKAGVVPPNSTSDQLVQTLDIYPTVMSMIGRNANMGQTLDGVSITNAFSGNNIPRNTIYNFFPQDSGVPEWHPPAMCAHWSKWKLIKFYCTGPNQTHEYRLYDLSIDPGEEYDVSLLRPDVVDAMGVRLNQFEADMQTVVPLKNEDFGL